MLNHKWSIFKKIYVSLIVHFFLGKYSFGDDISEYTLNTVDYLETCFVAKILID